MTNTKATLQLGPKNPDISSNVFYNLMMAIVASSASMTTQQVADANTTINYGKLENTLNAMWYGPNGPLQALINKGFSPNSTDSSKFAVLSANAQASTSAADALVQQSNSQMGTDATNIQQINQLGSTMNILGFIANLLAKG